MIWNNDKESKFKTAFQINFEWHMKMLITTFSGEFSGGTLLYCFILDVWHIVKLLSSKMTILLKNEDGD